MSVLIVLACFGSPNITRTNQWSVKVRARIFCFGGEICQFVTSYEPLGFSVGNQIQDTEITHNRRGTSLALSSQIDDDEWEGERLKGWLPGLGSSYWAQVRQLDDNCQTKKFPAQLLVGLQIEEWRVTWLVSVRYVMQLPAVWLTGDTRPSKKFFLSWKPIERALSISRIFIWFCAATGHWTRLTPGLSSTRSSITSSQL